VARSEQAPIRGGAVDAPAGGGRFLRYPRDLSRLAAAEIIAFGAAVQRSAAGTIRATRCTADEYNILGIADLDLVEKDEEGYFSKYDIVPVITAGRYRVFVTAHNTTAADIVAGDYLELADLSSGTNALPVGVFEEAGSQAGGTRTLLSLARALEDVALQNCELVAADVAIGDTTVRLMTGRREKKSFINQAETIDKPWQKRPVMIISPSGCHSWR
jgi:hypothetical protein